MILKEDLMDFIKKIFTKMPNDEIRDTVQLVLDSAINTNIVYIPIEKNKIKVIDVDDIIYVTALKKEKVIIYTLDEKYFYANESCNIFEFLEDNHLNFRFISSGEEVMVNLKKIKAYDSYFYKIFLPNEIVLDSNGTAIKKTVKTYCGSDLDINNSRTATVGEYSRRSLFRRNN